MIVIEAKHAGACAACQQPILLGERIAFSRSEGARHLACSDRPTPLRRNEYPARCTRCGVRLARGAGVLELDEHETSQGFTHDWLVHCADGAACLERSYQRTLKRGEDAARRSGRPVCPKPP